MPAHVVGQKALGIDRRHRGRSTAVEKAAKDKDKAPLKKIADFWNTGFDFTSLPSDKSLYLSDGAYILTDFKEDQYMTFEANPDYTWGPKPRSRPSPSSTRPDPTAAVQSLANGELQIINPQATEDVLKGLHALKDQGIETINGNAAPYEHVDLVFTNGGPFDPKSYGGDAGQGARRPHRLPEDDPAAGHRRPADQAAEPGRHVAQLVQRGPGLAELRRGHGDGSTAWRTPTTVTSQAPRRSWPTPASTPRRRSRSGSCTPTTTRGGPTSTG